MNGFKKTTSTSGKIKNVVVHEGSFVDEETGDVIDLVKILGDVYGDQPFDLSASAKVELEL